MKSTLTLIATAVLFLSGGASAQEKAGFQLRSINSPLDVPATTRTFIDRIGPANVQRRLAVEDVLPEVQLSAKISSAKNQANATVLRDLITASSKTGFSSSFGKFNVSTVAAEKRGEVLGVAPDVEALGTFQANVSGAFQQRSGQPGFLRIWRGEKVTVPDPYRDAVVIVGNGQLCTGTLISPQHVVSAAHCFCAGINQEVSVGTSLLSVSSRAEVDLTRSKSHIPCEQMATDEQALANVGKGDVALYVLKTPLAGVATRRLASEAALRAAAAIRAVGFGKTDAAAPGTKFAVDIIIASYDCSETTARTGGQYGCSKDEEMIAAGMNRDTCNGDSGGPVYILGQDVSLYLAGVTSRSVDPEGTCGKGGIYVKLTRPAIRQWLANQGVPQSAF